MRVLQLVQQAQMRGAEIDALQLGDELERRGVEVRTAYLYETRSTPSAIQRERDVRLGGDYGSVLERIPGWHPGLLRRLGRAVDDFRPDIIQAGGGRTVKYGALVCRGRPGCHLVWRNIGEIDRWMTGLARRAFYRRLVLPHVDAVVSMTSSGVAAFRSVFGAEICMTDIPPGIAWDRLRIDHPREVVRARLGARSDTPVALLVGALSPEKRIDMALEALSLARERIPELELWLAGEGALRGSLEALAERLRLTTAATFLGARDDIGDLLRAADLLLISSDTEGLPRAVLESSLVGTPIASTSVGGIPDVIRHGETGLLSPPGDPQALAVNMFALATDVGLARQIAAAARRWAERHVTIDVVATRYEQLYSRLVKGPKRDGFARRATAAVSDG